MVAECGSERAESYLGIVRLNCLAGPDVCALDGEEDFSLVVGYAVHHDVGEYTLLSCLAPEIEGPKSLTHAYDGSDHLHDKGGAWAQVLLLLSAYNQSTP
jgi:hypothetical protein